MKRQHRRSAGAGTGMAGGVILGAVTLAREPVDLERSATGSGRAPEGRSKRCAWYASSRAEESRACSRRIVSSPRRLALSSSSASRASSSLPAASRVSMRPASGATSGGRAGDGASDAAAVGVASAAVGASAILVGAAGSTVVRSPVVVEGLDGGSAESAGNAVVRSNAEGSEGQSVATTPAMVA